MLIRISRRPRSLYRIFLQADARPSTCDKRNFALDVEDLTELEFLVVGRHFGVVSLLDLIGDLLRTFSCLHTNCRCE